MLTAKFSPIKKILPEVIDHSVSLLRVYAPAGNLYDIGISPIQMLNQVFSQFIGNILARITLNAFGHIPCSGDEIFEQMSWVQHFAFNLIFLSLTVIAILFTINERRLMGKV